MAGGRDFARHGEACARWPLMGATAIHRHGKIAPGEEIVMVGGLGGHRAAALPPPNS